MLVLSGRGDDLSSSLDLAHHDVTRLIWLLMERHAEVSVSGRKGAKSGAHLLLRWLALEKVLIGGLNFSKILVPGGDGLLGLIVADSVTCRSFAKDVNWCGSGSFQGLLSLL